ncbi:hypothetical protein TWF718_004248 [Orbilia javanica]|uniref:Myb-like DNA-binding domain-containing protein n=1 Tax=Orbilia javanica TaxID=47235 RepID=A0AAN8NB51_9PEZI
MAKGSYKTDNCGAFLLSIIRHSDLKVVKYEAVGKEHGITAHSAYCRFKGIKNALKTDSPTETTSENAENIPSTQTSPSKKRGRKPASPSKSKGKKVKDETIVTKGSGLSGVSATGEEGGLGESDEDGEEQLLASPSKKQKRKRAVKVEARAYESDVSDWIE